MPTSETRSAARAARPDSPPAGDDFAAAIDGHRRGVVLLCYRFLGSLSEAEDAAQEAALRAWRARAQFRGQASLRTWLHRIAARVCLDQVRRKKGRVLPMTYRPPATTVGPPEPPPTDVAWLEPIPDEFVVGAGLDPAARYDLRESVSLAFIAALQVLPPRQRAVLLMRDVLGWTAAETAEALDMSVPAANSALHRARMSLRETHHRTGREAVASAPPDDPAARRLLDAYVRAWQADDVPGLLATMREDVRLAMPPTPTWYEGKAIVAEVLRQWVFDALRPAGGYRVRATAANGQPAAVFGPADAGAPPTAVQVLELDGGAVRAITVFLDPAIAERF